MPIDSHPVTSQNDTNLKNASSWWGSGYGYGYGLDREFDQIELQIVTAADRGKITSKGECDLLHQLAEIDHQYDGFRSKGLGYADRMAIIQRLRLLRAKIW